MLVAALSMSRPAGWDVRLAGAVAAQPDPPGDLGDDPGEGLEVMPALPGLDRRPPPGADIAPVQVDVTNPGIEPGVLEGGPLSWITNAIIAAIEGLIRKTITDALNPLWEATASVLLSTPSPRDLPKLTEVWETSRLIVVVAYPTLIVIAGLVLMSYESLQTRYTLREIAPRAVVGFIAANFSLTVAQEAVDLANAFSRAIAGNVIDPDAGTKTFMDMFRGDLAGAGTGELWLLFLTLACLVMIIMLLVTFILRMAVFAILVGVGPIALSLHALPQTESIAFWWWKALAVVLAAQVAQSLTLITIMKIFHDPGEGFTLFGSGAQAGWMNVFLALALLYILIKIPNWVLEAAKIIPGRSALSSIGIALLAYRGMRGLARRARSQTPSPKRRGYPYRGRARRQGGGTSLAGGTGG
ncbi:MAG: hypothetical protein ACRDXB_06630, partial [Actinomycetes bacterium]